MAGFAGPAASENKPTGEKDTDRPGGWVYVGGHGGCALAGALSADASAIVADESAGRAPRLGGSGESHGQDLASPYAGGAPTHRNNQGR